MLHRQQQKHKEHGGYLAHLAAPSQHELNEETHQALQVAMDKLQSHLTHRSPARGGRSKGAS